MSFHFFYIFVLLPKANRNLHCWLENSFWYIYLKIYVSDHDELRYDNGLHRVRSQSTCPKNSQLTHGIDRQTH